MKRKLEIINNKGNKEIWAYVCKNGKFYSYTNYYESKNIYYKDLNNIKTRTDLERSNQKYIDFQKKIKGWL